MTGRPPKPTAIKILHGNPGKRPLPKDEPQLDIEAPECPGHLDDVARDEWARLVPVLVKMRVLTEADRIALGNLCQTYSTMVQAQIGLSEEGLLRTTATGYMQQNPLLGIVNVCIATIHKISVEFGLTPAARVRIRAAPEEKAANKWSEVG